MIADRLGGLAFGGDYNPEQWDERVWKEDDELMREAGVLAEPLALVVGPEGGLAREEVEALLAMGAQAVTLGPRILRTETAALAALSVLLHLRGELG